MAIVMPNAALNSYVQQMCAEFTDLCVYKNVDRYPSTYEIVRLLNSYELDVVFLGLDWTETAFETARQIRSYRRATSIVGCAAECPPDGLRQAVAAGVSTILVPPFSAEDMEKALAVGVSLPQSKLTGNVFAFLSSKGGDGATTIGLNAAGACASRDKKVLYLEADLDSGIASTLMNITGNHSSIIDTLESAELLDDAKWSRAVVKSEGFDMLPVPVAWSPAEFSKWSYYRLLTFARERYDTLVVDLPAVVNDATEAILTHAEALY
ncbi:MAG: AAA family ATPase, partial [Bryobacteraceae bacterium]